MSWTSPGRQAPHFCFLQPYLCVPYSRSCPLPFFLTVSFNPSLRKHLHLPGMVEHTCIFSSWETEAG